MARVTQITVSVSRTISANFNSTTFAASASVELTPAESVRSLYRQQARQLREYIREQFREVQSEVKGSSKPVVNGRATAIAA